MLQKNLVKRIESEYVADYMVLGFASGISLRELKGNHGCGLQKPYAWNLVKRIERGGVSAISPSSLKTLGISLRELKA